MWGMGTQRKYLPKERKDRDRHQCLSTVLTSGEEPLDFQAQVKNKCVWKSVLFTLVKTWKLLSWGRNLQCANTFTLSSLKEPLASYFDTDSFLASQLVSLHSIDVPWRELPVGPAVWQEHSSHAFPRGHVGKMMRAYLMVSALAVLAVELERGQNPRFSILFGYWSTFSLYSAFDLASDI